MPKTRDSRGIRTEGRARRGRSGAEADVDVDVDWQASARSPEEQQAQEEQVIAWFSDDDNDDNELDSCDNSSTPKDKDKDKDKDRRRHRDRHDDGDRDRHRAKEAAPSAECSISKKLQALRDPPVCFCGRAAYETQDDVLGTIYDCHYTNTAVFPRGVRSSGMICGFHIHKEVCDQFRHQLQRGADIDEQDPELSVCPYFNFTACALLGMTNTYEKRTPPVTKCFCGLPMALSEPDTVSDALTFRCPNVKTPGARPKCSYKVRAEQVPFHRTPYLPHRYYVHHSQENAASGTSLRPPIPTTTPRLNAPPCTEIPGSAASHSNPNSDTGSGNNSDRSPAPRDTHMPPSSTATASTSCAVAASLPSSPSSSPSSSSSSPAFIPPLPLPPSPSPTSDPDVYGEQCVPSDQGSGTEDDMLGYPHTQQALTDLRKDPDVHTQFEGASESLLKKIQDVQFEIEALARRTQDMMKRSSAMGETEADLQRLQLQVDHHHSRLHEQERRTKRAEVAARTVQNEHEHMVRLLQIEDERRRTVQRDIVQLEIRMTSTLQEHQHLRTLIQERRHRKSLSAFNIKCCVCQHRTIEFAILPCFHSCYCHECVSKLQECAICRGHILGLQRIYYD